MCVARSLFFYLYVDHRDLHSFPTRRSSDLCVPLPSGWVGSSGERMGGRGTDEVPPCRTTASTRDLPVGLSVARSEEHTSELQSQSNLVCRLLLEKKNLASIKRIKTSADRKS